MKKITYIALLTGLAGILCACTPREGSGADRVRETEEAATRETETQWEDVLEQNGGKLCMVMKKDDKAKEIRLFDYEDRQLYQYQFSDSTSFLDKYGQLMAAENMTPGQVVTVGGRDDDGVLTRLQVSDQVWVYPDVVRFSIDQDRKVFAIADENYTWGEDLKVFLGAQTGEISDIKKGDRLNITGFDRKLLSVVVAGGEGTIALKNTDLFEGSLVQVGQHIAQKITKDMSFSVPEGDYDLAVANNGWGGQTKISVKRGKTTEVDLDKLKGPGPKTGKVAFEVDADNAKIYVDNKKVDSGGVVTLTYGNHALKVTAEGYDTWQRTLCVNSKEATIQIALDSASDSDKKSDSTESSAKTSSSEKAKNSSGTGSSQRQGIGSGIGSGIGTGIGTLSDKVDDSSSSSGNSASSSSSSTGSTTSSSEKSAELKDYVSTLTGMLDAIH